MDTEITGTKYQPVPSATDSPQVTFTLRQPPLHHVDFWPQCLNPNPNFNLSFFERFDTLLPRGNAWLREHPEIELVKCETLEKKASCLEDITLTPLPSEVILVGRPALYVKGLRLWFINNLENPEKRKTRGYPIQVGYRNYMPRCEDDSGKYPAYQDLGPMYAHLNDDLIERPLEGPIITVETVPLHLDRHTWEGPDLEVDKTFWPVSTKQHILFFTRVYYLFQCPAYEQVGAADFLPDFLNDPLPSSNNPKYTDLPIVTNKINAWLKQVRDIRITNIQSLEAAFLGRADQVNTSSNFMPKSETIPMIRFVRVSYTRPKFGLPPGGLLAPKLISQKTFSPTLMSPKLGQGDSVTPGLESFTSVWEKAQAWLSHVGNPVVSIELVYHPLSQLWMRRDKGETTVLPGEWVAVDNDKETGKQVLQLTQQVQILRVYLEGEHTEPSFQLLPNLPHTGEGYKDCCSLL